MSWELIRLFITLTADSNIDISPPNCEAIKWFHWSPSINVCFWNLVSVGIISEKHKWPFGTTIDPNCYFSKPTSFYISSLLMFRCILHSVCNHVRLTQEKWSSHAFLSENVWIDIKVSLNQSTGTQSSVTSAPLLQCGMCSISRWTYSLSMREFL